MPPWSHGEAFEVRHVTPSGPLPVANYRSRALGPFSGRRVACSFGGCGLVSGLSGLFERAWTPGGERKSTTPDHLLDRFDRWLDLPGEPACLLHGDLWGGNYLVDDAGGPVLIDPAAYRGHREADLAMTRLFGGFDAAFCAAYQEEWPLALGSGERLPIYELYHLLNHLNLFGAAYRERCLEILRRYAG